MLIIGHEDDIFVACIIDGTGFIFIALIGIQRIVFFHIINAHFFVLFLNDTVDYVIFIVDGDIAEVVQEIV